MTTEVLYRKWRPRTFAEVVGQEHVSTTLRQSVLQGRVAHAYLFCGPRGTGKTSMARILAKAVNCLKPQNGEPCNECVICQAVNEGRFMDLIEVDAASNRRIDDFRDLRDKVPFAPTQGRRKVYIIDESHQLTGDASNAFLKTLEEPPAHVVFILCTTEPHEMLPTITSRCQRFDFKRISSDAIAGRLEHICRQEGFEFQSEALRAIGRAVSGSMRDAANLLEQLTLSYGSPVTLAKVQELLGLGGSEDALSLVRYLLQSDIAEALTLVNRAAWGGVDIRQLHRLTLDYLRSVLVYQCGAGDTLDQPAEVSKMLQDLARNVSMERVATVLTSIGEVNLRYNEVSVLPLELAIVGVCTAKSEPQPTTTAATSEQPPAITRPPVRSSSAMDVRQPTSAPATAQVMRSQRPPTKPAAVPSSSTMPSQQNQASSPRKEQLNKLANMLRRQRGKKYNVGSLLRDCQDYQVEGDSLRLVFTYKIHYDHFKEEMEDVRCRTVIEQAFADALGKKYRLEALLPENNGSNSGNPVQQSPMVRTAIGLGAKILEAKEKNNDE